jgi:hypothetical protein
MPQAPAEDAVRQRSLFDDPERELVADLRETQHRKYESILATGKAAVVLAVARTLPQPFRLNDLSVACHKHDPGFFGMEGYKHHPDNHKIHSFLYGRRGLIRRGHLERIAEGLFRVPLPAEPESTA